MRECTAFLEVVTSQTAVPHNDAAFRLPNRPTAAIPLNYAGGFRDSAIRSSNRVSWVCSSLVRQLKISPATTT